MTDMARIAAMDIRGRDGLPRFHDLICKKTVDDEPEDPEKIIDRITKGINSL